MAGKKIISPKILIISVFVFVMMCISATAFGATVSIEAEDMQIYRNFTVFEDESASSVKFIKSVNSWGNTANYLTIKDFPDDEKDSEIKFNIPEDGRYLLYVRFRRNITGNSVHIIVDETVGQFFLGNENIDNWEWVKGLSYRLTKGEHTLRFQHRGRILDIDKIILTTDVSFVPEGTGKLPKTENKIYEEKTGFMFYQLPAYIPSGDRPRLMVRKDELSKLKENLNHPTNKEAYETIVELANTNDDCKVPESTGTRYNSLKLSYVEARAFMYLITGDKEWGEKAKEGLFNHLDTVDFGKTPGTDAQRYGGHVLFVTACVYDWCYDVFTPSERQKIIDICDEKVLIVMENGWPPLFEKGQMQLSSHATENSYLKDILAFSIAVYDEEPYYYNTNVGLLIEQYLPVRNLRSKGWYNFDGSTYSAYRGLCDAYCNYMLSKIGYKTAFNEDNTKMPYQFIYILRPDGARLNDGDYAGSDFSPQAKIQYPAFYLLNSTLGKDPILKGFYYTFDKTFGSAGQDSVSLPIYLITNDVDVKPESFTKLPYTKYFGSPAGVMVARTGWNMGLDTNDVVAMMKLPERFWGSHEHYDAGSFQIFYKGMLALDSGLYASNPYTDENGVKYSATGWGSTHDFRYHKATIAHNCMLVYDPSEPETAGTSYAGQTSLPTTVNSAKTLNELLSDVYKRTTILGYDYGPDMHTPEYTYFEGDLTNAYSNKVNDYSRSFMFLNLFDEEIPAAFIVYDRIESKNKNFEKTWLLHSQEEPEVFENRTVIRRTEGHNNGRLINDTLLPENANIEKVGGKGKEFWVNGTNYYVHDKEEFGEGGKWRIEITPDDSQKKDYFLNVMQVSADDDSINPLKVEYKELDKYIGIYIKDRAVFLRKDKGVQSRELTIEAEADGELSYIVTNLKEGLWRVYNETGKEIVSKTVNGENGVLYFKEKSGKYTLKWEYSFNVPKKDFNILNSLNENEDDAVYISYNGYYENNAYKSENGNVMVDLIGFIDRIGAGECIVYDNFVIFKDDVKSITFTLKSNTAVINNSDKVIMGENVLTKDGIFYVPLDDLIKMLEIDASYTDYRNVVSVEKYKYKIPGANEKIYQYKDKNIAKIKDITFEDGYIYDAYRAVDGDINTNWSTRVENAYIDFELMEKYTVEKISIAHYLGAQRKQFFSLYASVDGVNWTEIYKGESNGKTTKFQDVVLETPVEAKYIKFVGEGNSQNEINNIGEVIIYIK